MKRHEFEAAVEKKIREGLSFVSAVYQGLDEDVARQIEREGLALACQQGCNFCCHLLVSCTQIEWDEIASFIRKLPRPKRRGMAKRYYRLVEKWRSYYERQGRPRVTFSSGYILNQNQDWEGRPCAFLNSRGGCDIYPVRPIDCRILTSTTRCTSWHQKGAKRFRFESEIWANQMILDKQGELGRQTVTPLLHWLLAKRI
jgi:Fe-S-cluster containining protein